MSHHSQYPDDQIMGEFFSEKNDSFEEMDQLIKNFESRMGEDEKKQIGPTHTFPDGKLTGSDEGGLWFRIGILNNSRLVIYLGKSVRWIGMTRNEALDLIRILKKKVKEMPI